MKKPQMTSTPRKKEANVPRTKSLPAKAPPRASGVGSLRAPLDWTQETSLQHWFPDAATRADLAALPAHQIGEIRCSRKTSRSPLIALDEPAEPLSLRDAIAQRHDLQHLACRALAARRDPSDVAFLVAQLRATQATDEDRIVSLVLAIRGLGGDIPPDDTARLSEPAAPFSVRSLFYTASH